jgi:hypothetical protein
VKAAIVVTSINDCTELLNGYLANFAKYGREPKIYLIPDKKTPKQKLPKCIDIPSVVIQQDFLTRIGFHYENIPLNSDNRRNVGYLMALEDGAETIISIDDDNYCPEDEDFIGEHSDWLRRHPPCVRTHAGWVNNCELFDSGNNLFPRGFPYYARSRNKIILTGQQYPVRINAGMWIKDPDLDAMTWIHFADQADIVASQGQLSLAADTWCPINSQNTAVHRDLMPAYYFIRMVPPSDRFGDIFQGYFALKVAKHMGWTARFGSPVVTHRRNSHVYLKDVQKEIEPILMLEELLPKLIEHKLTGTTIEEAYLSLADFIEQQGTQFYSDTARLMRQWAATCRRIG